MASRALPDDRHGLLVADDRQRHDGYARPHGDLDEAAAPEASELVPVADELPGGLGALGEHQHELLVVVEQPVGVVGVRGHAAGARPEGADDGQGAEEVLGQSVHRAQELGLDAVHHHRRVRGDGAAVVGHQERAAVERHVLESFPFGPQPVAVHRVVERGGRGAHPFAATPGVDAQEVVEQEVVVARRHTGSADGPLGVLGLGVDEAQRRVGRGHPPRKAVPGHDRKRSSGRHGVGEAPAISQRVVRKRATMPTNRASIHSASAPQSQSRPPSSTTTSTAAGR